MSHHKPDPNIKVNLTIDGIPVTVPEGTRILEAAKQANVRIPVLCEHPELCKRALCRICVVEADGRGKLIAACANDVWEGVNIVTKNLRLLNIRKTIMELILANHPQDCLSCVRNTNCELQTLAHELGVRDTPFVRDDKVSPAVIESGAIVRDMDKCIKCGRCVEACQEVQKIGALNTSCRSHKFTISAPYKQTLKESGCNFCGQCAEVCPVGAIYEHDQTAQAWEALNDSNRHVIALINLEPNKDPDETAIKEFPDLTTGKIIAALKLLGFKQVYNKKIPEKTTGSQNTQTVSFVSGISQKYRENQDNNIALTPAEFARMIKLAGINISTLPEENFDDTD